MNGTKDSKSFRESGTFKFLLGLLTGICMMAWLTVFDAKIWPSDGATTTASVAADPAKVTTSEKSDRQARRTCGTRCQNWAQNKARQFRNGLLKNSRGEQFPRHVRKKIRAWVERFNPDGLWRGDDNGIPDWMEAPWNAAKCAIRIQLTTMHMANTCAEYQRQVANFTRETSRVAVKCSGNAVIGFVIGRAGGPPTSVWAAGAGGGVCLWEEFWDAIY